MSYDRDDRVTGVTNSTYQAKALAFMMIRSKRINPETPDKERADLGVMITKSDPAKKPQWKAWDRYFAAKRIRQPAMRSVDQWMVPAALPEQFDAEYRLGPLAPEKSEYISPERRAELADVLRRVAQRIRDNQGRIGAQKPLWHSDPARKPLDHPDRKGELGYDADRIEYLMRIAENNPNRR